MGVREWRRGAVGILCKSVWGESETGQTEESFQETRDIRLTCFSLCSIWLLLGSYSHSQHQEQMIWILLFRLFPCFSFYFHHWLNQDRPEVVNETTVLTYSKGKTLMDFPSLPSSFVCLCASCLFSASCLFQILEVVVHNLTSLDKGLHIGKKNEGLCREEIFLRWWWKLSSRRQVCLVKLQIQVHLFGCDLYFLIRLRLCNFGLACSSCASSGQFAVYFMIVRKSNTPEVISSFILFSVFQGWASASNK